jgi:hypothetical protein
VGLKTTVDDENVGAVFQEGGARVSAMFPCTLG